MNWIHLDLKGTMPGLPGMLKWLDWLAKAGFDGVVFEYEDRLPWQTFPGLHRPVLTQKEWQTLWEHCRKLRLEVVPLVQTQGHLEWVLKHPQYAHLREAGYWDELCPSDPASMELLLPWVDEVIAMHPDSDYIHLGADETWNLVSCPKCKERAASMSSGKMGVFLAHIGEICRHVIARGKRPVIWADMFWRTDTWSTENLPKETVLIDWQYVGAGPWSTVGRLRDLGHEVWGASALRRGFDEKYAMPLLASRTENVMGWNKLREAGEVPLVLHTVWGRGDTLRPIYGPWEGWLPSFLAAGNSKAWKQHKLEPLVEVFDLAMASPSIVEAEALITRLEGMEDEDPMVADCISWWILSLQHLRLLHGAVDAVLGHAAHDAVRSTLGIDPARDRIRAERLSQLRKDTAAWRTAASQWLDERGYSDRDEYLATKLNGIERCIASAEKAAPPAAV